MVDQVVKRPEVVQVPKTIMVPQTVYEPQVIPAKTIQVPRPVYETRKRTIQVPKMVMEDKVIEEQVPVYETKSTTVQVPRTVLEPQVVTNYQAQLTAEPVTVQVPLTQTQMVAQQINKVIEYKREPVNTYTVAGQYFPVGQPQVVAGATQATFGGIQATGLHTTGLQVLPAAGFSTGFAGYGAPVAAPLPVPFGAPVQYF